MSANTILSNTKVLNQTLNDMSANVFTQVGDMFNLLTVGFNAGDITNSAPNTKSFTFENDVSGAHGIFKFANYCHTDLSGYAGRLITDVSLNYVRLTTINTDISGVQGATFAVFKNLPLTSIPSGTNNLGISYTLTASSPPPYLYTLNTNGISIDRIIGGIN